MSWFTRKKQNIEKNTKKDLPNDLWRKCSCGEILYNPELEASFSICHHCNFHFPITSKKYQDIILDEKSDSLFSNISSIDILGFKANKSYEVILEAAPINKEAVDCFLGEVEKLSFVVNSQEQFINSADYPKLKITIKDKLRNIIISL